MNNTKQTTLEDRVTSLEKEVSRLRDAIIWIEGDIEQAKYNKEKNADIKLKIDVDTTEAVKKLQAIQNALEEEGDVEDEI